MYIYFEEEFVFVLYLSGEFFIVFAAFSLLVGGCKAIFSVKLLWNSIYWEKRYEMILSVYIIQHCSNSW